MESRLRSVSKNGTMVFSACDGKSSGGSDRRLEGIADPHEHDFRILYFDGNHFVPGAAISFIFSLQSEEITNRLRMWDQNWSANCGQASEGLFRVRFSESL